MPGPPAIGLLGDVMLGRGVADRLAQDPPEAVWSDELRELCASLDAVICNLECCVSERGEPTGLIRGKPFFFRAPPVGVDALRAIGVEAVGLANNHALDFGPAALEDTLELVAAAGVAVAGAGRDTAPARRGAIVDVGSVRVGVLSLTDHPREFAAGPDRLGVAHADLGRELPRWVAEELEHLREGADLVVAFPHWGPNMTSRPARWQRRRARELLTAGADAVAGHSAHVFHGVERRDEGLVLYDLGDALDDYAIDRKLRNDLGVLAVWRPHAEPVLELIGLYLDYCFTDLARERDAEWIAQRLEVACGELDTEVERTGEQRFVIS